MSDVFNKKDWIDRQSQFPTRRRLTNVQTSEEMVVDVAREEGTVQVAGHPFNAAGMNDLENRIESAVDTLQSNFQDGVDSIYNACVDKGSTPSSHAIDDIVKAIENISGGSSYTAGAGISIANNVITNTRKGSLSGVIDEITSGGYAHTQINNALNSVTAGGLVVLKAEASGTANTVRIQYGEQASQSQAYRLCDTDLEYTTINVSVGDTIILMFDTTGYRLIVLSVLNNSGGSGSDSYAGLGIGKMTSFTNDVIDTDIDLHRAPITGDRLLIYLNTSITNPRSIKIYNNGAAISTSIGESKTHPAGLTIFRYIGDLLGWLTVQDFAYTAGKNISIVGTTINNTAPQLGMNVAYGEVTSVTDGNIGQFNGNVDYLDIDFKVNAESYAGGYTLLLSQGTMLKYAVLKNRNGYNYTANISAGTILHCLLNVSGTGTEQDPIVVKVIDENVVANPSTTPSYNLEKLKIGNITYNTSGLKMYDAYSISSGVISIHSANTSQYNGMIIAVNTGAYSGTTTNAWTLALNSGGTYLPIAMTKADGTDFTDALSENELLFVYVDTTSNQEKAIVVSLAGASGGTQEVYFEQSVTLSTSTTTTVTFTNSAITATSVIDIAVSEWGIVPDDVNVSAGVCTVVMPKVSTAQTITVGIFIKR